MSEANRVLVMDRIDYISMMRKARSQAEESLREFLGRDSFREYQRNCKGARQNRDYKDRIIITS